MIGKNQSCENILIFNTKDALKTIDSYDRKMGRLPGFSSFLMSISIAFSVDISQQGILGTGSSSFGSCAFVLFYG